ncbi:MAG: AMP-dependent synthetase [SAR202 cluster bacterium Io17-Chloro-G3]|nr:MAG: AMP-dependent synthetase [SAR202 cluster bacterium Io17-Chloro-G3]
MDIGHLLSRSAQRFPDRPAWMTGDQSITYAKAEDRVNRLGNALLEMGAEHGDRVGMILPNCHEGLEAILAPMRVGMTVVPMNVRLHPREHQYLLEDSGATILIYSHEFRDHVAQIRETLGSIRHFICVGGSGGGDIGYETLLQSSSFEQPNIHIEQDDVAWIFYTSGTTGHPKGAMLTHRNLMTMVEAFLTDINSANPDDVLLHAAPITHGSGLMVFHHLARGAASAFPTAKNFDPPSIFKAIQKYKVTTMFVAPTMINIMLASPERHNYDISSLHTVVYGGGPMYTEHIQEALEGFGCIFVQIFGQGESPMTITTLPKEEHRVGNDPIGLQRLASAGREVTGVRVRIVDDDDKEVSVGELGEIAVRSDLVMKGYWNRPDATAETLKGGWLHTGDLGYVDSDGYLFITDRKKDMIISGGANIYPREVEEIIAQHPSVFEVAVIGVPDVMWGESVKALVVVREGCYVNEEAVIEYCKERLGSYKKPKSVEFLPGLPKNAYGKILKRDLREKYWIGKDKKV